MIPAEFEYEPATSVEHAIELLGRGDDPTLIAGGHSLVPAMRLRMARLSMLVDLGRVAELRYVRDAGDRLAIGATTRHADILRDASVAQHCAVLAQATRLIADPQVRNRGTIGGAVAHGDPASDQAAVLVALEAELVVRGPDGERTVPVSEFFHGVFTTALRPRDVLTEIRVPKDADGVYSKFTRRSHDWATVGVAAVRAGGLVRVGLASMGPTPLRARAVEAALAEGRPAAEAAELAAEGASPPSDAIASAEYRAHLARVLTRRALDELA